MNIYQKKIIDISQIKVEVEDSKLVIQDDKLIINQSENAYIEKYVVTFENPAISEIKIDNNLIDKDNGVHHFELDFSNRCKSITIYFVDEIADPLKLNIEYNATSKEEWDEKNKRIKWKELEAKADIKVATGTNLVNIYFKPCSAEYSKAEIELYTASRKLIKPENEIGNKAHVKLTFESVTVDGLMGKFMVENGMYYQSIMGLADRKYGFKLSQYSSNNELLFTSDYIYFVIAKS